MTATVIVACDGHRSGQPCRGALPTGREHVPGARYAARQAGWRRIGPSIGRPLPIDLCPSAGHDEDATT